MKSQSATVSSQLFLPYASPVTEATPCGPALEYARDYLELENLLQGVPEQQYGDTVIPGEEPDWRDILNRSLDLLSQTRDLRLAVIATRASVECHGIGALPSGLDLVATLLEKYWEAVHPEREDGDSTFRLNALAGLNDHTFLLKTLRNTTLLESRGFSGVRIADLEKLHQGNAIPNLTRNDLSQHLESHSEQGSQLANVISNSIDACKRIDGILEDKTQTARFCEDLQRLLSVINAFFPASNTEAKPEEDEAPSGEPDQPAREARPDAQRGISNRNDISRLIDQMCCYLEAHEPGHPAPLLLRRAQKLLGMDFLSIIRELNPDSIRSIEQLAGITSD